MRVTKRKRLFLLFTIAVLLPAIAVILLAWRVIRQDAELAKSRAIDERHDAVEQLRRELSTRLEAITLQEINRRLRAPETANVEHPADPAIVLVAAVESDRIVFPWESSQQRLVLRGQFADLRKNGMTMEFKSHDLPDAIDAYLDASRMAKTLPEKCEAGLLAGRVYFKAGRMKNARAMYESMLKDCGDAADPFGMRYGLYAAERLVTAFNDAESTRGYVAEMASRWLSPPETYLVRSLLPAEDGMTQQIARTDRVMALSRDYARTRSLASAGWVAYGTEPWLITESSAAGTTPLLFVVSAKELAPPLAKFVSQETGSSISMGEGFPGLRVEWLPGRFPPPRATAPGLYVAVLAFVIGATVLGGYLLLRDVNRDLRLAELRTHFVASVSHELKTPLTSVRMFAETLLLGRAPDERTRAEYLETITNESERLTRLVDNVLDFSKIEQGKKVYRLKPTVLVDVVRSAAQAMQYPLAKAGFTLNVSVDDDLPAVEADADALQQAILNLLSNAMKYSGGAAQIDLRLGRLHDEAVIEIVDHGIGIAAEDQGRIFEKFYRVRSPQTDAVGGTGLGLTLVKHIVEGHRGRVEVRSKIGQGSTFAIWLPL